jgi:phosphoribosylformylglycinamidine cyclo-ligase
LSSWKLPEIFQWLQTKGNVSLPDMLTTFNCGIGMIVCVAAEDVTTTMKILQDQGETVFVIGYCITADGKAKVTYS